MAALLEDKREAEKHAAEAERLLEGARAAVRKTEGRVSALEEAELRNAAPSQHVVVDSIAQAGEEGTAAEKAQTEALQVA